MGESSIGCNDLDEALVEQLDVGGKPGDAAARKTLQHRAFQQSGRILGGDLLLTELAPDGKHRGELSIIGACRCAGRVGMTATNDAIMRASSRSFLASVPLAWPICRSLNGLIWRTDMPAASKARTTPRS